ILDILSRAGTFAGLDSGVREEAVASAGRMGIQQAIPSLIDILTRKAFIGHAEPTSVRLAAVQALGTLGGDLVLETLRAVAQGEGKREVREAAVAALNARGVEAS